MLGLIEELYPICRSITGDGVRATLKRIGAEIALRVEEVPSGTEVFDWTVPREWNIRDAYVKDLAGERVIDFQRSNLHLLGYSVPIAKRVSRAELDEHLFSLPEHPDWIPYRTSYYQEAWGFCVSERQREALGDAEYEVVIDSSLEDGALTYGECLLEGETRGRGADLAPTLSPVAMQRQPLRDCLGLACPSAGRFPAQILVPLSVHPGDDRLDHLARPQPGTVRADQAGLVLTCVGDSGSSTYKQAARRRGGRPGDGTGAARLGSGPRDPGLQPLGLRRAPVLLARVRPSGRLPHAHPARPFSRVPHLGRQPRVRARRGARGFIRQLPAAVRRPSRTAPI